MTYRPCVLLKRIRVQLYVAYSNFFTMVTFVTMATAFTMVTIIVMTTMVAVDYIVIAFR
jgi:hypothetical protein